MADKLQIILLDSNLCAAGYSNHIYIFHFYTTRARQNEPYSRLRRRNDCRQCGACIRYWVACSVPQLWTHISLSPIAASTYPHLGLCLSRSGSCPLHIHGERAIGKALKAQITRLLPDAHRWKTLWLDRDYLYKLPGVLSRPLPCLERAVLHLPLLRLRGAESDVKPTVLDLLADAPRLHALLVWAYEFPKGYVLRLPTSCALTTLCLESPACDIQCVAPLIRQCSQTLRYLSLRLTPHNKYQPVIQFGQRIEMHRLTSIDIGRDASRFLACLRLPRLAAIDMRCGTHSLISILELFAEDGACPQTIRNIRLMDLNSNGLRCSNPQVVQQLLQFLQILEDLRILTMDIGSDALIYSDALVPVEIVVSKIASEGFLPNLIKISIRTGSHPASSKLRGLVREMTRARAAPSTINGREVVALERVVTDFDYASESEQEVED